MSKPRRPQVFTQGARGELPVLFHGLRADELAATLSIPGASQVTHDAAMTTWEAAPEIAAMLGRECPPLPEPDIDFPGLKRYEELGFKTKLRNYQKEDILFFGGLAAGINAGPMRCLAGDAELVVNRGGAAKRMRLDELVRKFNGGASPCGNGKRPAKWRADVPTMVQFMTPDGFIRLNRVVAAHETGEKAVFAVRTTQGTIRASADHHFAIPGEYGFARLSDLRKGDDVLVIKYPQKKPRPKRRTYIAQDAMWNHPFAVHFTSTHHGKRKKYARVPKHRVVAEAALNGLAFKDFVARIRADDAVGLKFLDPKVWAAHHKDEDTHNNSAGNLTVETHTEHFTRHGRDGGWQHVTARAVPAKILSIKKLPPEPTFDLTMETPHHNYVASGFVVHNSGKSPTMLGLCEALAVKKVLIVCPSAAEPVWTKHIANWCQSSSLRLLGRAGDYARRFCLTCQGKRFVLIGDSRRRCPDCIAENGSTYGYQLFQTKEDVKDAIAAARYVIVGYDALVPQSAKGLQGQRLARLDLAGYAPVLASYRFDVALLDESHCLRGYDGAINRSRRGKTRRDRVRDVCRKIPRVYQITGTPIYAGVADLWGQLSVLFGEEVFGKTPYRWLERYADMHHNDDRPGWTAKGLTNEAELSRRLRRFMMKRLRKDILKDLPPKTRQVIEVELSGTPTLGGIEIDENLINQKNQIGKALSETAKLKIPTMVENVIDEIVEGAKVVVFCKLRDTAEAAGNAFREAVLDLPEAKRLTTKLFIAHGGQSADTRFALAEVFREWQGGAVFIATIDAFQVAVSLAGATTIHFLELDWVPSSLLQAEDRSYEPGIGSLHIVYWVALGTIDEHVIAKVLPKMAAVDKVMVEDGASEFVATFTEEEEDARDLWKTMLADAGIEAGG